MPTAGQGPHNDPRLVERRGDLSGRSALLFLLLVVAAFGIAFVVVLYVLRPGGGTAAASASPSAVPSVRASATTAAPTVAPSEPVTFGLASETPVGPGGPVIVPLDKAAPVTQDGATVGTVTVTSADFKKQLEGEQPPDGKRWLLASVTYRATAALVYDANMWFAVDTSGERYGWRESDPPPALGEGSLTAGGQRTGNVSFEVPARKDIMSLVLTDEEGNDIVVVRLPGS